MRHGEVKVTPEEALVLERVKKLKEIEKKERAYKKRWEVNTYSDWIISKYSYLGPGEETSDYYSIAGRIMRKREHGKILFLDLIDSKGKIQIVIREDVIGKEKYGSMRLLDRGDIIGVKGNVIRTKRGEISLLANEVTILSKCLRPWPEEWYGIKDKEVRFRHRYLDFIFNKKARGMVLKLSKIIKTAREYMDKHGFIEVFTPELQPIYGGGAGRPFETYYWALDRKVYLRIAPETYLKRLLVAMYERVYEIGRIFRNEGIDWKHHPEYICFEYYAAWWDYRDQMKFTENLIKELVSSINNGSLEVTWKNYTIDFSKFERWDVKRKIKEETGIDVSQYDYETLKEECEKLGLDTTECKTWGELVDLIRDEILEPKAIQPTFMYPYPLDVSPLAQPCEDDPKWTERFEGFVCGFEIANAYSELNNPIIQFIEFEKQERMRQELVKKGKLSEYHPMDREYVIALEYAMPPASGCGLGLQRILMVCMNLDAVREAVTFPLLREYPKLRTVCDMFPEIKKLYERKS